MRNKKSSRAALTLDELQLIDDLRAHPELVERMQMILQITRNADGSLKSADEAEALLVEEMRQLGNTSLTQWAAIAEKRLGERFEQENASAHVRKKKR